MNVKLALIIFVLVFLAGQLVNADYIWHYDEIPYEPRARCRRGTSYYTNNAHPYRSTIYDEVDRTSLLDYNNKTTCFSCICSVHGRQVGCVNRPLWYCNYYRVIARPGYIRDRYDRLFKQNRPAYFRSLSYRMRRRMDDGVYDLLDLVGSGNGSTRCTPYVSEYTDCSEENLCTGCTRCTCDKDGDWACKKVIDCSADDDDQEPVSLDVALDTLLAELKEKKKNRVLTPPPPKSNKDVVVGKATFEDYFSLPPRLKRSVDSDSVSSDDLQNRTIKFYNTVNEINKDTLKNTNDSGTVKAHKFSVEVVPKNTRRTFLNQNPNKTVHNSLHIGPNQHIEFDRRDAENKLEPSDDKKVLQNKNIAGNYSHSKKDVEISKIIANELKNGKEIIGEKGLNPVSNITFTAENDTIKAMAFVAGNLLSKLWEMEKYTGYGSIEADTLKHEKINDLLDLFKEPLSIKQETVLKNALEKLANYLAKNKNVDNLTFCETFSIIDDNGTSSSDSESSEENNYQLKIKSEGSKQQFTKRADSQLNVTSDILSKLKNILTFFNYYEKVQKNIEEIEGKPVMLNSTKNENSQLAGSDTIETIGNIVNKISKLLIPNSHQNVKGGKKSSGNKNDKRKYSQDKFNVIFKDPVMTAKDQIILEYIKHIESKPSCLFNTNLETEAKNSILKIEGNILNNISEFLKIKSFEDLMTILKKETKTETIIQNITAKSVLRSEPKKTFSHDKNANKMQIVKENLKKHLKAVINDLIEIQSEDNSSEAKKVNVAQALPCIYGLLNEGKPHLIEPKKTEEAIKNIKTLIDDLKLESKTSGLTRRQHSSIASSQSIKVFERVIKNINDLPKHKTRRNMIHAEPKTVEQIKSMIEKAKLTESLFNNMTIFSNITEKNQLMLLKALEAETKKKQIILSNIKTSIEAITQLPTEEQKEIHKFVETVNRNIDLSHTVLENILRKTINVKNVTTQTPEDTYNVIKTTRKPDEATFVEYRKSDFQFTKEKIINQLIMNRVSTYMRKREAPGTDLSNDIKYLVAGNILSLLRAGNPELAKELFKFFMNTGDGETIYKKKNQVIIKILQPKDHTQEKPWTSRSIMK